MRASCHAMAGAAFSVRPGIRHQRPQPQWQGTGRGASGPFVIPFEGGINPVAEAAVRAGEGVDAVHLFGREPEVEDVEVFFQVPEMSGGNADRTRTHMSGS